jgi:hypothetical protein
MQTTDCVILIILEDLVLLEDNNMSEGQVNITDYGKDDYSGFSPHQFSVSSPENGKFGPSMNPDGFLPRGWNPPPIHLSRFAPTEPEPTENQLYLAKRDAAECNLINEHLGEKWLGIDYADPNSAYNCFCAGEWPGGDKPDGPSTDWWVGPPPGSGGVNRFIDYPWHAAAVNTSPYTPPSYEVGDCGANFDKYIEYSKTNATFWNTPPKTPLYRRAQTALLMYNRIRLLVHGDFNIKPGKLVKIDYSLAFKNNTNVKKSRYDGNWMVYRVQHVITGIKHSMYVFLMRDGSETDPRKYNRVVLET